jgi:hypothetical protein
MIMMLKINIYGSAEFYRLCFWFAYMRLFNASSLASVPLYLGISLGILLGLDKIDKTE